MPPAPYLDPATPPAASHLVTGTTPPMTFRAKPTVKRAGRPSHEDHDRRNFYINLLFVLVVAIAVIVLVVVAAASYYNAHLSSVGSVAGQSISRDEFQDRGQIEAWRLNATLAHIRTEQAAGRLTEAQAASQTQYLQQQQQQLAPLALERVIDNRVMADLAAQEGITVTDADIDARLTKEATTPEQRHAFSIEVAPELDQGAVDPTDAQKTAAKAKADQALKDLQGGKAWDEVAKAVSTDTATAATGGDIGWIASDDPSTDEALLTALFAAQPNTPTAVIEGADGTYRIGRYTDVAPETVDSSYQATLVNDGIDLAKYRQVVKGDVIRQKLQDKVVADATQPGPQRQVREIFLSESDADTPTTAVRVRHILFSPKDDASGASELDALDPAWAAAKVDADKAYAKLQADPTLFDSIARAESDEDSARGVTGTGGKLPGYVTADSQYVQEFKDAVLAPGLKDGQILAPFKTSFGWHIVQIQNHPPDQFFLESLKQKIDGGADFATIARDQSDGAEAGRGGDLGWIAKGQKKAAITDPIFATPIGKTSAITTIANEGSYLWQVVAEENRTPEGRQLADIKANAFADWYQAKKDAVTITRDESITGAAG
jgi:parvulin-like peptidyl-prolyl isomerase